MASKLGPRIVTDNLVLALDCADAKSYPGEPTTNFSTNPKFEIGTHDSSSGGTWNNWVFGTWYSYNHKIVDVTDAGMIASGFTKALRVTSDGTSNAQHLSNNNWGSNITAGTVFSLSFWGRASASDTTWIYSQWGGTVGYPEFTTEWKYFKFDNITKAASSGSQYPYFRFEYGPPPSGQWFEVTGFQVEAKSYSTPLADISRSAITSFLIHGNVGTGTSFEDSSPNKITVSNQNSVSHGGTSNFGGSAIQFSSSSSQQLTSASTDVINFGTEDWTIEFWFNMTNGSTARMHALSCGPGNTNNIDFNFNDSYAFWLYWNSGGSPYIRFGNDGDYGDGNWHHLMATRASGVVRVWVDGVHKGSNNYSSSTSMGQTASIYIGGKSSVYWDGFLDEIRIIKGTALWSGGGNFSVPTERFKNGAWLDISGNENNGNFINELSTGTSHYRVGDVIYPAGTNSARYLDFDGTDQYIDLGTISSGDNLYISQGSIELWFKYSTSQNGVILGWGGGSHWGNLAVANNWTGSVSNESIVIGSYKSSTDYYAFYVTDGADYYGDGNWHHIVFTKGVNNSTNIACYIDGVQKTMLVAKAGTGEFFLDNIASSQINVGRRVYSADNAYYNGQVASIKIYSDILTQAEALQNYNSTKSRFS